MKKKVNKNVHKVLTRVKAIALIAVAVFISIFGVMKPPSVVRADGPFEYIGSTTESITGMFPLSSVDFLNYTNPTYSALAYPQAESIITYNIGMTIPRTPQKDTFSYVESTTGYQFHNQDVDVATTYLLTYRKPVVRDWSYAENVFSPIEDAYIYYDADISRYVIDSLGFTLNDMTNLYCCGVRLNYAPFFMFDSTYQYFMFELSGQKSFTDYKIIHKATASYIDKNGSLVNSFEMTDNQTFTVVDFGVEVYCPFMPSALTNGNLLISNYEVEIFPIDYSQSENGIRYNLNEDGAFYLYNIYQYAIRKDSVAAITFEQFNNEFINRFFSASYVGVEDVGASITRTIDKLLSIEIFPDFSFYSILILVVVLVILAAVIKMFLGGH